MDPPIEYPGSSEYEQLREETLKLMHNDVKLRRIASEVKAILESDVRKEEQMFQIMMIFVSLGVKS